MPEKAETPDVLIHLLDGQLHGYSALSKETLIYSRALVGIIHQSERMSLN